MLFTRKLKLYTVLSLLSLALLSPAHAEDTNGSQSSVSNFDLSSLSKNLKANYLAWLIGPSTKALDGDVGNTGYNQLTLIHYPSVGFKLNPKMTLMATTPVTQKFGAQSSEKPAEQLTPNDPYISLSHSALLKNEKLGFNMSGLLRYYAPFSTATNNGFATKTDARNGQVRFLLNPTKTFFDEKLTVSAQSFVQYRFARSSAQERIVKTGKDIQEDYYYVLDPSISYDFSAKFSVGLEYCSGYMRHTSNGHFSNTGDTTYGQYLSPNATWSPTKKLMINPYLSWGESAASSIKAFKMASYDNTSDKAFYKNMDIGMIVQYTFL